jgi:hypothetical protein
MPKKNIEIGRTPNDGTGDNLKIVIAKVNENIDDIYAEKQDALVSGSTIKTINGNSLLGSGNLEISSGGGASNNGVNNLLGYFPSGLGISASIVSHSATTLATVSNNLLLNPFIPAKTIVSSSLNINVTIIGIGVIARILIYSDLNGLPNTKLYESSDLSLGTLGIKTATTAFTFTAGTRYWLGLNTSGIATLSYIPTSSVMPIFYTNQNPVTMHRNPNVAIGSAPSTYNYSSFQTTAVPLIWINS